VTPIHHARNICEIIVHKLLHIVNENIGHENIGHENIGHDITPKP